MLSWEFPPHIVGGLGKHVADLAPALAEQGLEVHVVTPGLRGGAAVEQLCEGATVYRVPVDEIADTHPSIIALSQASNRHLEHKGYQLAAELGGFDIIHGHDWLVAYASVALKYALKRPLIVTVHSMERGRMQGTLSNEQSIAINGTEWWLTYESWRVVTVSSYMAQQVHRFFSVPFDKLDIVYNGVQLPQTHSMSDEQRAAFRARFAQPDQRIVYYVGRLVHEKGVQVLIQAAPQIVQQMPNVKFVIAGTGVYLDELRQLARDYNVSDQVVFTGFIADDVRDKLYQVADVAVFPSLYEPFGIVALEAMAYGCPVVASETGGLAEFVRPHQTGILTHTGDPASLAWGILHSLMRPDWTAGRAQNALAMVKHEFTWQRIAAQTAATYDRAYSEWQGTSWGR
jgi:glycosyltransferase involved in cell wall biosynthesis